MIKNNAKQHGRSMLEMLAVLAIIGVLSITALVGFTYAMNKHRANTIYNDVHLLALHVMDTGKGRVPADFYSESGLSYDIDTTTYTNGFVVKVAAVSEKVCDRIMEVNDPSIEKIYVGSEETTTCSGTQDIGFMFLYDGTFTSGGGASGGSSGGISSGGSTDPVDPCEGIVPVTDCGATDDMLDQNGCLIVQKISCGSGSYCSGQTCEPCPAADTCSGESCCALTGPDDVCGNPTKEIGTISTVTHSDLNADGCCVETTEESCSLNPITPRTCTPTCDGTCQSDGTCPPNCEAGETYNEIAGQCCLNLPIGTPECQTVTVASLGVCPTLINVEDGSPCMAEDGADGICQSGVCEAILCLGGEGMLVTGKNGHGYCMSKETMNWADANTWCEERGRHLASVEEMCPGCDGRPGNGKCTNLAGRSGSYVWSSSSFSAESDDAYSVYLWMGNITSFARFQAGLAAFCY